VRAITGISRKAKKSWTWLCGNALDSFIISIHLACRRWYEHRDAAIILNCDKPYIADKIYQWSLFSNSPTSCYLVWNQYDGPSFFFENFQNEILLSCAVTDCFCHRTFPNFSFWHLTSVLLRRVAFLRPDTTLWNFLNISFLCACKIYGVVVDSWISRCARTCFWIE